MVIETLKSRLLHLIPQSDSVRNVLKLAGGTAGSYVIAVAVAPILTRLYGPQSFGILAAFSSILNLLNVVSSLRYELAIVVPKDDEEAIALVWLCFVLVAITTALSALGVILLGDQLAVFLKRSTLKPLLWLLPVGVLLSGIYQPLSQWAIRHKKFGLLAQTKFRQSIFGLALNIAAAPLGPVGLVLGQIVSQSAGFLGILRQSSATLLQGEGIVNLAVLVRTMHSYSQFGLYSSSAGVVNIVSSQVPILLFAASFGAESLGQLDLALKILLFPAGLVGNSVSQVFLARAAESYHQGTLSSLAKKYCRQLFLCGLVIATILILVITPLMPIMFGNNWLQAAKIIPLLVPLFLGSISVSAISPAFLVCKKNKEEFFAQVMQAVLRIVPLIGSLLLGSCFLDSVLSYSIGAFIGYIIYFYLLQKSLTNDSFCSPRAM
jgi:O-antigen/teichoic acid export membrane protein